MDSDSNEEETKILPVSSDIYSVAIQNFRAKVHTFLEVPESSTPAKLTSICMLIVIVASICCFVLETVQEWQDNPLWMAMEIFSTVCFTAEYVLRFWTCDVFGKQTLWKFFMSPMNLLDFLAILPFYIDAIMTSAEIKGLRVLRSIRLIRLFRVFKLGRYNSGMLLMTSAVRNSIQALSILVFFLAIGVILFSSLLFYAEKLGCPQKVGWTQEMRDEYDYICEHHPVDGRTKGLNGLLCCDENFNQVHFGSIMKAMWWSMVTMTTVGFGDQVPRTGLGRFIAGISMVCGILLISLPVAIVGNKFQEAYDEQNKGQIGVKKKLRQQALAAEARNAVSDPDPYKASNFIHLHRKHRVTHLRDLLLKFGGSGVTSSASEHLKEILRLLEEATQLEKDMIVLKSKDRRTEKKIAVCLEYLFGSHVEEA